MAKQPGRDGTQHAARAQTSARATTPPVTAGCVIAGVSSGVGKTTIATGLMAALAARGRRVQPFKVGPDYIDPSYHSAACGWPSRNLDTWMVGEAATIELFRRATSDADVAVVEGVMGLYDGRSGGREQGSTAQLAKLLGLPVLLVIDAGKLARSAGALAIGYRAFDPAVQIAGVILNRAASGRHAAVLCDAVEQEAGIPVLGVLPRDEQLALPERYLGLVPVVEGQTVTVFFERARAIVARDVDVERIATLATIQPDALSPSTAGEPAPALFPAAPYPARVRIAVAMDRAFSFYYPDNLDLLRAWGAELVPFSPLADAELPCGAGGIYIGGGFPELFAEQLAANRAMRTALRRAAAAGCVVYGECGGLMYLGGTLTDAAGRTHEMTGLLPLNSTMRGGRLTLGYREVRVRADGPLAPAGHRLRGHEFHWSVPDRAPGPTEALYDVDGEGRLEGFRHGSVYGSYIHIHFGSDPTLAPAFVRAAAEARR